MHDHYHHNKPSSSSSSLSHCLHRYKCNNYRIIATTIGFVLLFNIVNIIQQNIDITQKTSVTTTTTTATATGEEEAYYIQQHNISSNSYCWIGEDNKITNNIKKFVTTNVETTRQNLQFTCPGDTKKKMMTTQQQK